MSKTGQWIFEMQEDAGQMTQDEFLGKHGETGIEHLARGTRRS